MKDTEKIREHLKIEKWHVFGGSWVRLMHISHTAFRDIICRRDLLSRLLMHRATRTVSNHLCCGPYESH